MNTVIEALIYVAVGTLSAWSAGNNLQKGRYGPAFVSAFFAVGMLSFLFLMSIQNRFFA